FFLTFGLSACLLGSACSSDGNESPDETQNQRTDISLSESSKAVASDLNNFYINFTIQAVEQSMKDEENLTKNVVVSPFSTSLLLGMLANGIGTVSNAQDIAKYLGVKDLNALNEFSHDIMLSLPEVDKQANLLLANSVWLNDRFKLSPSFYSTMLQDYLADIFEMNFSNPSMLQAVVNDWVDRITNQTVSYIPYNGDALSMAILINALYFKNKWENEYEFDTSKTTHEVFNGFSGPRNTDFMVSTASYRFFSGSENFTACWFYFGNGAFSLMLVLPDDRISSQELDKLLTQDEYNTLTTNALGCGVEIKIPKFKIQCSTDLNKIFYEAGLEAITSENLWSMFSPAMVGSVSMTQHTCFEIDEQGVTSSAVSEGVIAPSATNFNPETTQKMVFDRPFYFFIREVSTGACLLSGFIADL
ncbi:MAG: hypothetical protein K2O49_07760, partial [Muribaculaceae bacterium]|nr:hypothetical protein [Muribaculaceae bacterium]